MTDYGTTKKLVPEINDDEYWQKRYKNTDDYLFVKKYSTPALLLQFIFETLGEDVYRGYLKYLKKYDDILKLERAIKESKE